MATTQIRGLTQINSDVIKTNGSVPMAAALQMGSGSPTAPVGTNPINQLSDPVNPQDGATKHYVDAQVAGAGAPTSSATARVFAAANVTQSATQTIDGIALAVGNVVCCNGQTTPSKNGLWVVATGAWTRAPAMANWSQVPGLIVSIQEGTTYHDTLWLSVADAGGTLETTTITFTEIPGPQDIIAGAGLTRTGQTLQVAPQDNTLAAAVGTPPTGGVKVNSAVVLLKGDYVIRETPTPAVNGTQTVFTLGFTPAHMLPPRNAESTEQVYLNGLLQEPGSGNDYTISGNSITFPVAPLATDRLRVSYLKGADTTGP